MMKAASLTFVTLLAASPLYAQEPPQSPPPTKEHEFLKQFIGTWETEGEANVAPAPDQPKLKCTGSMKGRMLGGYWLVSESKMSMMGADVEAVQTIGYDPEKKKYVGSWVDSMFNYQWQYDGSVDETGKILTLNAEGPSFLEPGKIGKFRDVYEFKSKDHIVTKSEMQNAEGEWVTFMTGSAKRKK
jgi:hypothetical protein